jgi:hypothetical protein
MVMAPATLALAEGAKITLMSMLWPGASTCPVETPLALKPGAATLTLDIAMVVSPEFVTVA